MFPIPPMPPQAPPRSFRRPTSSGREPGTLLARLDAVPSSSKSERVDWDQNQDFDWETPAEGSRRRQRTKSERTKESPLVKRLGEMPPMLSPPVEPPKPQSTTYPGVVLGTFTNEKEDAMDFLGGGAGMDEIVAAGASGAAGRNGSASGNIAPWLMDDHAPGAPPPSAETTPNASRAPSRKHSLNHHASTPSLSQMSRNESTERSINAYTHDQESRDTYSSGSTSVNVKGRLDPAVTNDQHAAGGRQARASRFGSTASSASSGHGTAGDKEKKKGFLGGFLKRKTGASVAARAGESMLDFNPAFDPSERPSVSGSQASGSSRMSHSTSHKSLHGLPESTGESSSRRHKTSRGPVPISPAANGANRLPTPAEEEPGEPEMKLDLDLTDMEGIVDTSIAAVPPSATSTSSTVTDGMMGSLLMSDAPMGMASSSFATTVSTGSNSNSTGSGSGSDKPLTRSLVSRADGPQNPFTQSNPFSPSAQNNSFSSESGGKPMTPPSPHTLIPRAGPSTQPRRPSQLRNMNLGLPLTESEPNLQPLEPAWETDKPSTVFNTDPFGTGIGRSNKPMGLVMSPPVTGFETQGFPTPQGQEPCHTVSPTGSNGASQCFPNMPADPSKLQSAGLASLQAAVNAAWAAPESWGVEGDEDEEESTEEDELDGPYVEEPASPEVDPMVKAPLVPSPHLRPHPPPFGYNSRGGKGGPSRAGTASRARTPGAARPSTGTARPGTSSARPGTAGSIVAVVQHMIRIYRADGSYTTKTWPLATTTSEIIHMLSGKATGVKTGMKLYIRERGQDRQLLPSEKPLAIQRRRLEQAGYTEADNLAELGMNDLSMLCRFIYQTPVLPQMDPEEESSYDSFEFIDIAGRDLQVIPIFLHLHAHNIIILNISRNPLTDIPLDFIQACTNLRELRMANMALKRIPASIRHSATLGRLDVSCNRIADLESVSLNEVAALSSIQLQNNRLASLPSYFAQMDSLKYLNISNNKFATFPTVVCDIRNLVDLDISFNDITELPSEMSQLQQLAKFACVGNALTTFPESFSTLANLRELDVRRNKLVDLKAVYALPNLAMFQADSNNLVVLDAQLGSKVREFGVPFNSITRFTLAPLPEGSVAYAITHLNLSHGKLSSLSDEALGELHSLVSLKLDFNQFVQLPSCLGSIPNLQYISCTDNFISSIPDGLGQLTKLKSLNIHNNNLREIPGDVWLCPLEMVNISSNLLETLPDPPTALMEGIMAASDDRKQSVASTVSAGSRPLAPMALSLEQFYLADNRLSNDVFHPISLLSNLKVLNLSFNDILEVPDDTLNKCHRLEALYLSGNKLTGLPAEDLESLSSLKILHLNGNKLQTLPSELGALKTLHTLDVGSNVLKYNIANWPYDWNWNWNTGLRYLNLSGNKRLEIKPTSAQDMPHGSNVRKELSDFSALTQLRVLGLMDVTVRIQSLPDESDERRVRTSFSEVNGMAYGISDTLGSSDALLMFDLVVPEFRGNKNECLFGMFGRASMTNPTGRIAKYVQETFSASLQTRLEDLRQDESITDALRRTFLEVNKQTYDFLTSADSRRKGSVASFMTVNSLSAHPTVPTGSIHRTGASGAVVYLVDKTIHVANCGNTLVVISRKGEAELLSKKHDPAEREETARIRAAEAWVSTKGLVNDDKDISVSRAFGFFHATPAVNAAPEIRTRELAESDEFIIIGNRALWDCCSYQTAVDIARTQRDDPMMAAQKLRDFAISYGAVGSLTVMVINVNDLVSPRSGRLRSGGVGQITNAEGMTDSENYYGKRAVRRKAEEVGDRTLNRLQQEVEPPIGQVALVFTDIKNSTALWETNEGMRTAIKMHHSLMRRQLRLDGGYEVKTEGDAFMVSFPSVASALLWSFNCQLGLLKEEWPRELLECEDGKEVWDAGGNLISRGLSVRMGLHWGSPVWEKDPITRRMDYYGPMVNRCARISASADGGQIMASQDVINELQSLTTFFNRESDKEEGQHELPPDILHEVRELQRIGIGIKDMGDRKLKGLEVPERLSLVFPRALAGRLHISNDLRANVEVNAARTFGAEQRQISIEEVRQLSSLSLRLEALSASKALTVAKVKTKTAGEADERALRVVPPPAHLGPSIQDDVSDEELTVIIDSLATRIENSLSTLYLKQIDGFAPVLAALQQAVGIDPKLLLHALQLMTSAMQ